MQHAGASYETDTTQYLYISGGMEHDTIVSTLFRYDVQTNKWTTCKPMLSPRADHVMLTIGNYLYVCGGWKDDESRMRTHNCAVDRYIQQSISFATFLLTITYFNSGFYILGTISLRMNGKP